jgi:hypothetical protein
MAKVGQASCLSHQRARTGLRVFLVNQSGEDNFRFQRTRFGVGEFAQRGEHRGDGTFRVARAAPVQAAVFALRNKLSSIRADGVEMRREQNGLPDFIFRQQPRDDVAAAGQDFLEFHFQPGAGGGGGEKIGGVFFAGVRMARRQEGGVDARQSDEFGQQFFRARHGGRMPRPARGRKPIAAGPAEKSRPGLARPAGNAPGF